MSKSWLVQCILQSSLGQLLNSEPAWLLQASLDAQSQAQQSQAQQSPPGRRSRLSGHVPAAGFTDIPQPVAAADAAEGSASGAAARVGEPAANGQAGPGGGAPAAGGAADGAQAGATYTSTMNVRDEPAGHPDYLAALTVVAAFSWITPNFLHRLVVAFERDMIETEVGLAMQ